MWQNSMVNTLAHILFEMEKCRSSKIWRRRAGGDHARSPWHVAAFRTGASSAYERCCPGRVCALRPALYKTGPVDCHRVTRSRRRARAACDLEGNRAGLGCLEHLRMCFVVRSGHGVACPSVSTSPSMVTTSCLFRIGGWPIQPVRVCVGSK